MFCSILELFAVLLTTFDNGTDILCHFLCYVLKSNIRHKDFPACSLTLRVPPLNFETGWTGELWSATNLLKWQN